jgi:hypothetical protein
MQINTSDGFGCGFMALWAVAQGVGWALAAPLLYVTLAFVAWLPERGFQADLNPNAARLSLAFILTVATAGLIAGAATGLLPSLLLRQGIRPAWWWLGSRLLSLGLWGTVVGTAAVIGRTAFNTVGELYNGVALSAWLFVIVVYCLVIRTHVTRPAEWALASVLGALASCLVFGTLMGLARLAYIDGGSPDTRYETALLRWVLLSLDPARQYTWQMHIYDMAPTLSFWREAAVSGATAGTIGGGVSALMMALRLREHARTVSKA